MALGLKNLLILDKGSSLKTSEILFIAAVVSGSFDRFVEESIPLTDIMSLFSYICRYIYLSHTITGMLHVGMWRCSFSTLRFHITKYII